MTCAERKVKERYPDAVCRKVRGEGRYIIINAGFGWSGAVVGRGDTRALAWREAASKFDSQGDTNGR